MNLDRIAKKIAEVKNEYPSLDYFKDILEKKWHPALEKAWNWSPRIKNGHALSIDKACQKVKEGKKPIAYGWRNDIIDKYAKKHDLESDGISIFLPENKDLADFINYLSSDFDIDRTSRDGCFLYGLFLGYPINDIINFCKSNKV